jgi:hypothetical protein
MLQTLTNYFRNDWRVTVSPSPPGALVDWEEMDNFGGDTADWKLFISYLVDTGQACGVWVRVENDWPTVYIWR